MARLDRVLARHTEAPKPSRPIRDRMGVIIGWTRKGHHTSSPWWRARLADLIERRRAKAKAAELARKAAA